MYTVMLVTTFFWWHYVGDFLDVGRVEQRLLAAESLACLQWCWWQRSFGVIMLVTLFWDIGCVEQKLLAAARLQYQSPAYWYCNTCSSWLHHNWSVIWTYRIRLWYSSCFVWRNNFHLSNYFWCIDTYSSSSWTKNCLQWTACSWTIITCS